jgi:hypothetical protein
MKKTNARKNPAQNDDLPREIRLDYSKARPNRFAKHHASTPLIVVVDSDLAKAFPSGKSVNDALRSLLTEKPVRAKARRRA